MCRLPYGLSLLSALFSSSLMIDVNKGCSETISVSYVSLFGSNGADDGALSGYQGDYTFGGYDSTSGYPIYYHLGNSNGAFITVEDDIFLNDGTLAVSFTVPGPYTYYGITYGESKWTGTKSSNGDIIDVINNQLYYIKDSLFGSTSTTTMFYSTDTSNVNYPIVISGTFDDCDTFGLSYRDTTGCPNAYDDTIEEDCHGDDFHCDNCQPWGCQQCEYGYFKNGNFQKCQSCNELYSNCLSCSDWGGCNSCETGYTLTWTAGCQDEVCIPNDY